MDASGLGPFGPWQLLLHPYPTEPDVGIGSLEGLAEVREANTNTGHQHFVPTLEFFTTWLGFNFEHNLEKALQMPQKFYRVGGEWSQQDFGNVLLSKGHEQQN